MPLTSNWNIWTPDDADNYDFIVDSAATAQTVDDALTQLDKPLLPATLRFFNNSSGQAITSAASTWSDHSPEAGGTFTFGTLDQPLEVIAHYSGVAVATGGDFVAFGVATSGGLVTAPNQEPDGTGPNSRWIYTPFNTGTNLPSTGFKRFILPAGAATTFRAQALRSGTNGAAFNYWQVNVVPVRWV